MASRAAKTSSILPNLEVSIPQRSHFKKYCGRGVLNLRGSGAGRYKYIDISPPHLKQREPEYSSNFVAWLPSGLFVVIFAMICMFFLLFD